MHDIKENNTSYGKLCYDKNIDNIVFVNKTNKYPIINKLKDAESNRRKLFRGEYKNKTNYFVNDIVLYQNNVCMCIENVIDSTVQPDLDGRKWIILNKDTCFPHDNSDKLEDNNTVEIICDKQEKKLMMVLYTTDNCCFKYSEFKGLSVFDPATCKNKHQDPSQSKMYDYLSSNKQNIKLHMGLVIENNKAYYDLNDETNNIIIHTEGIYRITYNVRYHGSIYWVISSLYKIFENQQDIINESISRSTNRPFNDVEEDRYYEHHQDDDLISNNINHTFFLFLKKGLPIELYLELKFNQNNIIFVHPLTTWISIERVSGI
jgi:hypothetical protein